MKRAAVFVLLTFSLLFPFSVFAEGITVVDEADYLTAEEEADLKERLDGIRNAYSIDAAVVIVDTIGSKSARDYADDYYDYNGYGVGADDDGLLLLISREPREYHITTHRRAVRIFNDSAVEALTAETEKKLRQNDYYGACIVFADMVYDIAGEYEKGREYGENYSSEGMNVTPFLYALGISAVIAAIATVNAYKAMNTACAQSDADGYEKKGSFNLTRSNDIFLYSNVTKTKIESSSSGGGSTHTSSSGRSHGGGGGRY